MIAGSRLPESLPLIAPSAVWSEHLPVFNGVVVGFVALVAVGIVWTVVSDGRRKERLRTHAAELGWRPVAVSGSMPEPVAEAARSRRAKLVFATEQPYAIWLVWHQWSERSAANSDGPSKTRNLTRYFLSLGAEYPDVEVVRRTSIGALFMPVRGVGTGDLAFDKRFLVRGPGEHEAARLLTPAIREAMTDGRAPAWEISSGVLISAYSDAPTPQNLQPRADALTDLARMLP
ncbi:MULTISPECIES: hypothetical protein [Actinomadura]|uniref:Uncharacterized protein n=1 Tax=Actinomadura yumaensis TaxID=111807 RepID=A0ABW2CGH3_9ACTN|nr:hypothetical protein [Actinomadura sp. J1-007]MWK39966.1 hypothetical protein [Actinomadura sp. J1-007]